MLSADQIAAYAYAAGVTKVGQLTTAVAVAFAESGGDERAHNTKPPDDSYGLWQINMYGALGPERRKKWGLLANSNLYSPAVNAKAMADLSGNGNDWSKWTTFYSGAYEKHIDKSRKAAEKVVKSHGGDVTITESVVGTVTDAVPGAEIAKTFADGYNKIGAWIADENNWIRLAKGAVGIALLIGGLVTFAKPLVENVAASTAGGVVKKVIKG